MNPQQVTQLTKHGIVDLIKHSQPISDKSNFIFQILDFSIPGGKTQNQQNQQNAKNKCYKSTISDGFCKYSKCYFGGDAFELMSSLKQEDFPIIKVTSATVKEKDDSTSVVILKFQIIYNKCKQIGEPLDYTIFVKQTFTNPNGSNTIPQEVTGIVQRQQPTMLENKLPQVYNPLNNQNNQNNQNNFNNNNKLPVQNNTNIIRTNPTNQQINLNQNQARPNPVQINNNQINQYGNNNQMNQINNKPMAANMNMNNGANKNVVNGINNGAINNHMRNINISPVQQQQFQASHSDPSEGNYSDFKSLFTGNSFLIKGRVTSKSEKKTIISKKSNKEVKLFNIVLLGKDGDQISGTFFNEEADKWYDNIKEGVVYEFKDGDIKKNDNPQYNPGHFQITFNKSSQIKQLYDDPQIQFNKFNFIQISDIEGKQPKEKVDILGILAYSSGLTNQKLKDGTEKYKKVIKMYDQSQAEVEITLWGKEAERAELDMDENDQYKVVVLKNGNISEYNGSKNVGFSFNSQIFVHSFANQLHIPEVDALIQWKQSMNGEISLKNISAQDKKGKISCIQSIEEECNGKESDPNFKTLWSEINVSFMGTNLDKTFYYMGCQECKRKGVENFDQNGIKTYECSLHPQARVEARFICNANFKDATGSIWITLFDEQANLLLGMTATEAKNLHESSPETMKQKIEEIKYTEFRLKITSKYEYHEGTTRLKHSIIKLNPIDTDNDIADIFSQISQYIEVK